MHKNRFASHLVCLVIADSEERARTIRNGVDVVEVQFASARTPEELHQACGESHDIVMIDIAPLELEGILEMLRADQQHANVFVLVSAARIAGEVGLAGLLPKYRAMSCSLAEIKALVLHQVQPVKELLSARRSL